MLNNKNNCVKLSIAQNCIDVFSHFSHLPHAILLDSADSEHVNSRYDIIAIEPAQLLEVSDNKTFFNGEPSELTCFEIMNIHLRTLSATKAPFDLPFNGGWLGYFGYDLGRTIEKMPTLAEQDINLPQMAVGLYLDALIFDRQQNTWFYVSQPDVERLSLYEHYLASTPNDAKFELTSDWLSNMSQAQYAKKFAVIEDYLKSGDCYQINLAQRFKAHSLLVQLSL